MTCFTRALTPLALVAWLWMTPTVVAQVPTSLSYQGYLTSASGTPVVDVTPVTFSLYTSADGGDAIWTDTQTVVVDRGLFSVVLGREAAPLPNDLPNSPLFLGIAVNGDPEMTPRRALRSAPYALRSRDANTLAGATLDDIVALANDAAVPGGSRVPVAVADFDGELIDTSTTQVFVDGASLGIEFDMNGLVQWRRLVVELEYPAGQPSPLRTTVGQLGFNSVTLVLAESAASTVALRALQAGVETASIETLDGGTVVRERLGLASIFEFIDLTAPLSAGPLEAVLGGGNGATINAAAAGPWSVEQVVGPAPGPGSQPIYTVTIDGIGPAEFDALLAVSAGGGRYAVTLSDSGTARPGAKDCRLQRVDGLSPVVVDDGGTSVPTVRFGRATFECLNPQADP
ncbi:MAG: hypothetical protein AAFU65_05395 [Pseudomonadota bacterium]